MAETTKKAILELVVNNNAAMQQLAAYEAEISKCNAAIADYQQRQKDGQELSEQEANEYRALKETQKALKKAYSDTSYQMQKNIQQQTEAEGSLKSLRGELSQLNAQYDGLSREMRQGDAGRALQQQIENITKEISKAEEKTGRFQRNVGNYQSAFKGLAKDTDVLNKSLKMTSGGLGNVKNGFEALAANPAMFIFGMVLQAVKPLLEALKENEGLMNTLKAAMEKLKPLFSFVGGIVEKIAGWLGNIIEYVIDLAVKAAPMFSKIVAGAAGVGNAILQYMLTPIRTVIEAFKGLGNIVKDVFTGDFKAVKQHATDAAQGIGEAFKKGFSFKSNFETGQEAGGNFITGLSSKKNKEKAEASGGEVAESWVEGFRKRFDEALAASEKIYAEKLKEQEDFIADVWAFEDEQMNEWLEKEEQMLAAENAMKDYYKEQDKQREAEKVELRKASAAAIVDAMDGLSSAMEAFADEDSTLAKAAKVLAIAKIAVQTGVATAEGIASAAGVPFPANIPAIASTIATIASGMASAVTSVKSAKFARGGYVAGAGTATSDSIPAQLSNGESVMNAAATSMFAPLLSSLNQIGGGNAIEPPTGGNTAVLEQAIARGMQAARVEVSVTEIDTVRERMNRINSVANV